MLKFAKKQEKEDLWRSILPEKLMNEIKKREARLALTTTHETEDDTSNISMGTVKNRIPGDDTMQAHETQIETHGTNTYASLKIDDYNEDRKRNSQIWTMADSEMNFADQTNFADNRTLDSPMILVQEQHLHQNDRGNRLILPIALTQK